MESNAIFNPFQIQLGYHYLLIFNVNLEVWHKKYDLEPFWGECECGRKRFVNQPYAAKDKRGFVALPCPCGSPNAPFSRVDLNYDEFSLNSL